MRYVDGREFNSSLRVQECVLIHKEVVEGMVEVEEEEEEGEE